MKFLKQLLKKQEILDDVGQPYLTRYYLFWTPIFKVYYHIIHKSDRDRHLHDHPWPFFSLLLQGTYDEVTEKGTKTIRFFNMRLNPKKGHRLILKNPVHTLVFLGPAIRDWGFLTEDGWVQHDEYEEKQSVNGLLQYSLGMYNTKTMHS